MDYFLALCALVVIYQLARLLVWAKRINGQLSDFRSGIKPRRQRW